MKSNDCTLADDRAYLSQSARIPSLDTWHCRLGHVNNQAILDMVTKGLAEGMPIDLSNHPPVCTCCILGKQKRNSVPKVREGEKSDRPLKKVYIDLCGPHILSSSKNKYSVDIIDDYSGFPWSFRAKSKDAVMRNVQVHGVRPIYLECLPIHTEHCGQQDNPIHALPL